jgi:serine/threonine protein kinase
MSPEECDPDTFSFSGKAIDVWALGVTMFCLLYNRTPFWGETEYQIMEAIRTEDLKLPGDDVRPIRDSTREVLLHLLEKDV